MKKIRVTLMVIAAGIVIASGLRVFAISRTDMKTGLLLHDTSLLCNILYYGLIALTAAGAAVVSYFDEKRGGCASASIIPSANTSIVIGFTMLASSLCACYDGIIEMRALTPTAFLIAVDFIFALVMCVIAFATLNMKEFKPGLGFSYVFAGIYYVCRGIYCFMSRMAIATVPEYLIDCLTVICGAVFFVMFARIFSGNGTKVTSRAFFVWGTLTAVLSLSSFWGAAVSYLSGISDRIVFSANESERYFQAMHGADAYQMAFPPLPNVMVGVFALVAMVEVCWSKNAEEK